MQRRTDSQRSLESMNRPSIESLENRLFLDGTVGLAVSGGLLTITGDTADNSIVITDTGVGTFDITGIDGTSIRYNNVTSDPDTAVGVTLGYGLTINFGQGGNDTVSATNSLVLTDTSGVRYAFSYTGGSGNDSLFRATGSSGMLAVLDPIITDEVQTISKSAVPVDGKYIISFKGNSTTELDRTANAATVQAALQLVDGLEDVTVTGGPISAADFVVTFPGMGNVPLLTISSTMHDALTEKQKLSVIGTPADGDFTVTFDGNSSAPIDFDATAGDVQTALQLVTGMEAVTVTGGPFGTADFVVTFPGSVDQPLMTVVSTMTDGTTADIIPVSTMITDGNVVALTSTTTAGPADEIQHLRAAITPTAGSFTIGYNGHSTAAIAWNADADAVQAALRLVAGLSTVNVTGGPLGTADFVVSFPDMGNMPLLTLNTTNLTGVVDEKQTLTASIDPTAGKFVINYGDDSTADIAFGADAGAVQDALRLIPGLSTVTVTGGPLAAADFVVTFPAMGDVPALTVSDGSTPLTGAGSAAVTVSAHETTKGVALDEVQTLTSTMIPLAGTFKINWNGHSTADIAFDADAATVQTALRLVSGLGTATVTGGPFATDDFVITFPVMGDVVAATVTSAMTGAAGAAVTVNVAETVKGGTNPVEVVATTTAGLTAALSASSTIAITESSSAQATGSVTFIKNPVSGDRITLNDGAGHTRIYQAVSGAPNRALGQFRVLGTAALTMADFKTTVNADAVVNITASAVIAVDEVQTLTAAIPPTAGKYIISFGGNSTADLAFSADAAAVQTALRLLAGLGAVTVTGGPLATAPLVVTFPGKGDVAALSVSDGSVKLTGAASAAVKVDVAETTKGVAANTAKCVLTNDASGLAGNQAVVVSTFAASRIVATSLTGGGSTNVTADDTITLDDGTNTPVVFTFGTGTGKVTVGGSKAATAANLADAINQADDLAITAVANGDGTITLTQDAAGREGNTAIVTTSGNITVADFTGGLDGTTLDDGNTVTLDDGVNDPVVFTARENPTLPFEFAIGGSGVRTMANVVAAINAANLAGDVSISATDNLDGSCVLTNDNTGIGGNQTVATTGNNFAGSGMEDGLGSSIDCLSYTATLGAGTNYAGLSAGGSGQSYVWGDVSITGGAADDTVTFYGVYVGGNVLLNMAASSAGDTVTLQDDGTYSIYIGGNLTINQTDGLSTVTLRDNTDMMTVGGTVTINVGAVATGTAVTTIKNVNIDGQLLYTGGTGNDDVELIHTVNVGDLATFTMGAGAGTNALNVTSPEIQTFTPSASADAGTWTLSLGDLESAPLAYDADAADVQAALRGIAGLGTVTVTGGGFDTGEAFVVTFPDALGEVAPLTFKGTGLVDNVTPITVDVDKEITGFSVGGATAGGLTYTGGSGNDSVTLGGTSTHGGSATFTMGDGTNSLTARVFTVDGAFSYTGTAGNDSIDLGYSNFMSRGTFTANMGAGSNLLTLDNATVNGFTYTGGANNDGVTIGATAFTDTGNFTFNGNAATTAIAASADGTNRLTMDNALIVGSLTYSAGAGADNVTIGAETLNVRGAITLSPGNGANTVALDGHSRGVTFTGGTGADRLTMGARVGSGGYTADGDVTFTSNGGADRLDLDGVLRNLTYTGGADVDTFNLGAGGEGIFKALGNVTITGGLSTTTAANNGTIKNANVRGAFSFTGCDGVDTLNIGQGAGTGMIVGKGVTVTLNGGADILAIDDSKFNQSSGTTTVTTGAGADTISLDVAGTSSTTFYRTTKFDNTAGGVDIFSDLGVGGSHGTHYLASTLATRPVFTAFRSSNSLINGDAANNIAGDALVAPSYS